MRVRIPILVVGIFLAVFAAGCGASAPAPVQQPPPPPAITAPAGEIVGEHDPAQPLVIEFSEAMDAASVERALRLDPALTYRATWRDDSTLELAMQGLAPGSSVEVTVGEGARSRRGPALVSAISLVVRAAAQLEVTDVQPGEGADDVELDFAITVVFNRPVVPLSSELDQEDLPRPLTLDPPVEGEGEWVNTTIYRFRPTEPLLARTEYTATVAAGLGGVSGSALPTDYTWRFTTREPRIAAVQPSPLRPEDPSVPQARPGDAIRIDFAQPMERETVESALTVRLDGADGRPVEGRLRWSDDSLVFRPQQPWARGSTVYVSLEGARAVGGAVLEASDWQFRVMDLLRLTTSYPRNGARGVAPGSELRLEFSAPVDQESLRQHLVIEPKPEQLWIYWDSERSAYVNFSSLAGTDYTVTIGADLKDTSGQRLGEPAAIAFSTGDYPPSFMLVDSWYPWAFGPSDTPRAFATYRNVSRLDFALYSLSQDTFVRLNGDDWQFRSNFAPQRSDLLRTWTVEAAVEANRWGRAETELSDGGGPLPLGLYYLLVTAPEFPRPQPWEMQRQVIIVSSHNITMKTALDQGFAWITGWQDGEPRAAVPVRFLDAKGREAAAGVTDEAGVYLGSLAEQEPWQPYFAFAGAEGSDVFGLAMSQWAYGINPWKYDIVLSGGYPTPYAVYLYTDRDIYRPGQTVYFKGIIRAENDARYSLPRNLPPMEVTVTDARGQEIMRREVVLNDMGTFSGSLTLAAGAPLGYYNLWLPVDPNTGYGVGASFQVAEYRRPEFQVAVEWDREEYLQGDTATVSLSSSYYFGGPVANARVRWTVLTQDLFFSYQGEGYYDFNDYDYMRERRYFGPYGEMLLEGEGTTDAQGRFTFRVPVDIAKRNLSQSYTVEVVVTDVNDQEVSGRSWAAVHKGQYYIGLRPLSYVTQAGAEATIEAITVDSDSNFVPRRQLQVTFYEHRWFNVQEKVDGSFVWKTTEENVEVGRETIATGADGKALVSFVPENPGTYKVVATSTDDAGNEVRSSTYLWVSGSGYVAWAMPDDYTIQLIPDKKTYNPGDVARILIPSPYQGQVKALFTTERGRVLGYRVMDVESSTEVVEVPITEEHAPNIYFVALLMRGADEEASLPPFQIGYAQAEVNSDALRLSLRLEADRSEHYEPGDTATFSITATDSEGNPVQAEMSLSLVDKSVMALAQQSRPSIFSHFYSKRSLGVMTAVTLSVSAERLRSTMPPEGKGGGGGDGGGVVREDFPETAYWEPALRTDREGRATVSVVLPDNLTTWNLRAAAITADTLVAEDGIDIISTKDLLLRPVLPRFLVRGDTALVGAIVHNNSGAALTVEVTCEAAGLVGELAPVRVTVAPGGRERVSWEVTAEAAGQAVITMSGAAGELSDAVRYTVPIYNMTTAETVAASGQVGPGETRTEAVAAPERYQEGELAVHVEASLAAGMIPGLEYLRHYPYECIEQTLSRFLPNIVTARAMSELGIEDTSLTRGLAEQVSVGLQRIYTNQHDDGGWGWWYRDASDPYLSAYVVFGLSQAQAAGYTVDGSSLDRGIMFLQEALQMRAATAEQRERLTPDTRAYIAYVLTEAGRGDLGTTVSLFERRSGLSNRGRAYLAMALAILDPEERGRPEALATELREAAITTATTAHWEDAPDWRTMGTNTVTTAAAVQALSRVAPDSAVLPGAVRWLMAHRADGYWRSTYETASTILALTDYLVASGELQGNYAWSVAVNGEEEGSGRYGADNLTERQTLAIELERLLRQGSNSVTLERGPAEPGGPDTGTMYYSLALRYFPPAEELRPVNAGIIVAREYRAAADPETRVEGAAVNDMVQVKLTIVAPNDLHHVVVEDPLPAGCEGVDTSLKTTTVVGVQPETTANDEPWGWWWFSHSEVRDDKVVLFATYLPKGTYEYTYYVRASVPGEYNVRPVLAYQMYFPEVYGHSEGRRFSVTQSGE